MPVLTLSEKLTRFPPVLCRLLARHGSPVRALTTAELAARCQMSEPEVQFIAQQTTWDGLSVSQLRRFSKGCGCDFDSRAALRAKSDHMRKVKGIPAYLRHSPEWHSTLEPLFQLYIGMS